MKIEKIKIYKTSLPFRMGISHSLTKGDSSANIVVEIVGQKEKIKGYGEGAPRRYVTGESQQEAVDDLGWIVRDELFPWELEEASDIFGFVDALPDDKRINPAVCALETALLDALGQDLKINIIDFFSHEFYTPKIYYGGALPLGDHQNLRKRCRMFQEMKINKIKMKMGGILEENREALEIISEVFGEDYDLKIDVNCAWNEDLGLEHIPLLKKYRVKVVEQPMISGDPAIAEFAEAIEDSGILLMADESACSYEDMEKIVNEGYYNMINIRLSKLGGFRKSLKVIEYLRKKRLPFQIGCHLGESGILSAAGRTLSLLNRDSKYYDGSYDRFLLKENITRKDVSFGVYGEAGPLTAPGLGVGINRSALDRLSSKPIYLIER
jgi:L-Ala-D/L-Glu epimerase / N-acetyl-D-glutamate racemase